ncbi:transcriptional regulator [Paenibacillus sp. CAA11]|uniref:ROK family protein n=1 Tax=Paenibacillus sp. CAA11 TaxID=1532905 RepID=UPI000D3C3845|nr:ROK family protein [Paenibacillus sp. CAA11]AWB45233.1 transcriptional regulator [Paenibacillus sp. CAA11]
MSYAIGIDIGGTKTAIGLVNEQGQISAKVTIPTDPAISPSEMVVRIADSAKSLIQDSGVKAEQISGIGIGAPGPLDTAQGRIACPPNLPAWRNFPIVDELAKHFSYPIRFENDATAATLAEKWIGAAQDAEHFVFITISTGIGAGIYMHGKLITGASGNAGDVGHLVIDPTAGHCVCGQDGCWEYIASGTAIARQASELLDREVTTKEAFDLAAQGEPAIRELVDRVFRYIGIGCVTLINTLDPQKLVIGGGVSQVGDPLFQAVRAYVVEHALNPSGRSTPIIPAALQQDAGLIGAAALVHIRY